MPNSQLIHTIKGVFTSLLYAVKLDQIISSFTTIAWLPQEHIWQIRS